MNTQRAMSRNGWMYPVAVLVAATGVFWLYRDYQWQESANRQRMLERGRTVLESLAAGIRAQSRMGRYRPERLEDIFVELTRTPDIIGVRLLEPDGASVAESGKAAFPTITPTESPHWQQGLLTVARVVRHEAHGPAPGWGRGRGMANEEGVPWASGDYTLVAALDAGWVDVERARALRRLIVASAVWLLLTGVVLVLVRARARHRELETNLLLAEARAQRQAELANLGAGLAHETKNPLGLVRGLAQAIRDTREAPQDIKRMARDIVDEADRTVGQINSFLNLARPKEPILAHVDLDMLLESLAPMLQAEAQAKGARVEVARTGLRAEADEELLRRAVMNLAINAVRACDAGGVVSMKARRTGADCTVEISDTGCGIAPEDLPHVTEPYFSRFGGGTGLGLSIVEQIARAHGWTLRIESTPGKGTQVSLNGIRALG
ncbi:MAG: hypothetical protein IT365_11270 [Candidatus Hydrogenedentes bacterium]|nr:hypothetical protein [Candidatus Hydrogenedentota bacterium]